MTYAIAAAGTGGHVFPAIAVAEALVDLGVDGDTIVFFGGDRLETELVPAAGFGLVSLPMRGLARRLTAQNLTLPAVVNAARKRARTEFRTRDVRVLLGTGGYATVPTTMAARGLGLPYFLQEQNAHAGLANRLMARGARRVFTSFPMTQGLAEATYVGNPVRRRLSHFSRPALRTDALARYGFEPGRVTVGVVGGSLGATALNEAVAALVAGWSEPPIQIVHLVGTRNADVYTRLRTDTRNVIWRVVPFEDHMEFFFAASDFVIARSGGMVAEITATATPSILVPGGFGSKGHQAASARHLVSEGAALIVSEENLGQLTEMVTVLSIDPDRRRRMSEAAARVGKPNAAQVIARAMVETHA